MSRDFFTKISKNHSFSIHNVGYVPHKLINKKKLYKIHPIFNRHSNLSNFNDASYNLNICYSYSG